MLRNAIVSTATGRLLLLWAALVLIIGASYFLRQSVFSRTINALQWVSHTHEVRATVFAITADLNEMEVAAFAAQTDRTRRTFAVSRYESTRAHFETLLGALRNLTSDSNQQQERVGMLRARSADRMRVLDLAVREGPGTVSAPDLDGSAQRTTIDETLRAILARETNLMHERQSVADASVQFSRWIGLATALAQIVLLGFVVWAAQRQMRRRLDAESDARIAIGRARLIVESVREPIAVISQDLSIVQANRAFADFYGASQPVSGSLAAIEGWSDDTALKQRLHDVAMTRRELWDYETVQTTATGITRTVIVNARPMVLPDIDDTVALVTVSDLTAHKRSEEQILELNRQLEGKVAQVTQVNHELEAFSYSVSHDLRAPLRHISGFADKLQTALGADADEKTKHYCDVIGASARRMSTLIEDLLSYSRLGKHALKLQPVDMQSLVEEVRAVLMSSVEDRTIVWRIAPLPVAIADPSMLRLVWQNLIDNAIKYSANVPEAQIEIGCEELDAERVFFIRDNGAGFDMRYVEKLFGVFQRLHKPSAYPGAGIGLASIRRIIARHGGRTWAEGVPDQGATFHFSLPRHPAG